MLVRIEYWPSSEAFPPASALAWECGALVARLSVVVGNRLTPPVPQGLTPFWWLSRSWCTGSPRELIAERC